MTSFKCLLNYSYAACYGPHLYPKSLTILATAKYFEMGKTCLLDSASLTSLTN